MDDRPRCGRSLFVHTRVGYEPVAVLDGCRDARNHTSVGFDLAPIAATCGAALILMAFLIAPPSHRR